MTVLLYLVFEINPIVVLFKGFRINLRSLSKIYDFVECVVI